MKEPPPPPPGPAPVANADTTKLENVASNIVDANDVKEISNESIETVAQQVAKDNLNEIKLLEASGDQAKADMCNMTAVKGIPLM